MNEDYRLYHPKWYRRRMPIFWWLRRLSYTRFITRELTSMAVVYAALFLLAMVWAVARGPETWARFQQIVSSPLAIVWHLLVLVGLLFHTVTWLNLAPSALVLELGGRRVPDRLIVAAHYALWLVASVAVFWVLTGVGA